MTTVFDVPADLLIKKVAEEFKNNMCEHRCLLKSENEELQRENEELKKFIKK